MTFVKEIDLYLVYGLVVFLVFSRHSRTESMQHIYRHVHIQTYIQTRTFTNKQTNIYTDIYKHAGTGYHQ